MLKVSFGGVTKAQNGFQEPTVRKIVINYRWVADLLASGYGWEKVAWKTSLSSSVSSTTLAIVQPLIYKSWILLLQTWKLWLLWETQKHKHSHFSRTILEVFTRKIVATTMLDLVKATHSSPFPKRALVTIRTESFGTKVP